MPHSLDVRNIALRAYTSLRSFRKTASVTGLPRSTIHRWVKASNNPNVQAMRRGTVFRKMSLTALAEICRLIDADGYRRPEDIRRIVEHTLHKRLSTSCVRFWMKRAGYTRKKPSVQTVRDGLAAQQMSFCSSRMTNLSPDSVVSIDETCIYLDMKPTYGYAHRSKRFHTVQRTGYRRRWTLTMAVTNEGVCGWQILDGAANTDTFVAFLQSLDVQGRSALLLDNVAFHKSKKVAQVCRDRGLEPVYLPPYSPMLQPIEHCFSVLKAAYRRCDPTASVHDRLHAIIARLNSPVAFVATFQACWQRSAQMANGSWWSLHPD